jgi:hypothetical protein
MERNVFSPNKEKLIYHTRKIFLDLLSLVIAIMILFETHSLIMRVYFSDIQRQRLPAASFVFRVREIIHAASRHRSLCLTYANCRFR